eukprot:TRINITY_DN3884_c0_g1_i11.p2 TRINITY_DN3884_c0_g1~~TRINITY_DN3884_c0_g1_i11.p2  ORF type:complete len:189 (-),score=11.78 TRINITY_DN3884_c0_g1_i11:444-1010(-)
MLLDSILLGIIFVRISYPRRRGRSIFLSDSAVVARRDGVLKFMFRLADVRPTTVMSPNVRCHLYTFGHGRKTGEGEFIPVRVQEMLISYIDGNMLLPVTVEHTVDERSPLYGHSRETLDRMGTEIVVSFEATNEFGNTFSARPKRQMNLVIHLVQDRAIFLMKFIGVVYFARSSFRVMVSKVLSMLQI